MAPNLTNPSESYHPQYLGAIEGLRDNCLILTATARREEEIEMSAGERDSIGFRESWRDGYRTEGVG